MTRSYRVLDGEPLPPVDDGEVFKFAEDNIERYQLLAEEHAFSPAARGGFRKLLALWTRIRDRFDAVGQAAKRGRG